MIPLKIKDNKGKKEEKWVAGSWYDVTLKQFIQLNLLGEYNEQNIPEILEIFTDIPAKQWGLKKTSEAELTTFSFAWVFFGELPESISEGNKFNNVVNETWDLADKKEIPESDAFTRVESYLKHYEKQVPQVVKINEKPVIIPERIDNPAYAAKLEIDAMISKHEGKIVELFPAILACLLHEPYTGGSYDSDLAKKLIPDIEKMKAHKAVPILYFFLHKRAYRIRFGQAGLIEPTKQKKAKQGLRIWRNSAST